MSAKGQKRTYPYRREHPTGYCFDVISIELCLVCLAIRFDKPDHAFWNPWHSYTRGSRELIAVRRIKLHTLALAANGKDCKPFIPVRANSLVRCVHQINFHSVAFRYK